MPKRYTITFKKMPGKYIVKFNGNATIGELVMDVDGNYYFWPADLQGAWSAWVLKAIADKMIKLNLENPSCI